MILVPLFFLQGCCCPGGGDEEPPPPTEGDCCGVDCEAMPEFLSGEFSNVTSECDCAQTDIIFTRNCDSVTQWQWAQDPGEGTCQDVDGDIIDLTSLESNQLVCGCTFEVCEEPSHAQQPIFSLDLKDSGLNGTPWVLNEDTACCDPLFLEFTVTGLVACLVLLGGSDLVTMKITITEYIP
jgi:hypothetical protein